MSVGERAAKLALAGVFLGGLSVFSAVLQGRDEQVQVEPLDLVMLGLATYRSGRLVAYERVAAPLREPVTPRPCRTQRSRGDRGGRRGRVALDAGGAGVLPGLRGDVGGGRAGLRATTRAAPDAGLPGDHERHRHCAAVERDHRGVGLVEPLVAQGSRASGSGVVAQPRPGQRARTRRDRADEPP